MSTNPTWYDLLGVKRDASAEEIKAAWRNATDKFEPGSGTSQFRLFNEAADVLLNPERRAEYDAGLSVTPLAEEPTPAEVDQGRSVDSEERARRKPWRMLVGPGPDEAPGVEKSRSSATSSVVEIPATDAETPHADDEASTDRRAGGVLGRLAAIPTLVLALLAVVTVAAIVLAAVVGVRMHDRVQVFNAGPDASSAAERALTSVLSYDYRHMEADRDRAAQFLTPSYRKQYVKNFDDLLTKGPDGSPGPAEKTQAVVTADVLDTAVMDSESDRVRVIVFVNQTSVKAGGQPTTFQDRVVATMVHRDGSWLVDNIKSY